MKTPMRSLLLLLVLAVIAGCGSSPGPDSISSHKPQSPGASLDCIACHSSAIFTRRQIFGAGGDFGANTNLVSHHVAGASDPTSDQCLVCHDQSTHMFGTIRLKHADTGESIAYDPANPSSLESFCLSCHDPSGAAATFTAGGTALNPFNNGSTLGTPPYPYAKRIADSWAKHYGHGPNGNHSAEKRLTCLGTGQPGTGCHGNNGQINAHGSANQVLAAKPFNYEGSNTYIENDYKLCFDCHAGYPTTRDTYGAIIYRGIAKEDIFGVKQAGILDTDSGYIPGPNGYFPPYYTLGVTTHFMDHNVPDLPPDYDRYTGSLYNDYGIWGPKNKNLHWSHLGFPAYWRGDINTESRLVCVNCHDVHGSSTHYGAVYDEMGYVNIDCSLFPGTGSEGCVGAGNEIMGKMKDEAYGSLVNPPLLETYPAYCAFNCHLFQGTTKAWFSPIVEQP